MASDGESIDISHEDSPCNNKISPLEAKVNKILTAKSDLKMTDSQGMRCEFGMEKVSKSDTKPNVNGMVHNHIGHEVENSRDILENLHKCASENSLSNDNAQNKDEVCTCSTHEAHIQSNDTQVLHCQEKDQTLDSDRIGELPDMSKLTFQTDTEPDILDGIDYVVYSSEHQMPDIMRLITKDLSEPYSIYTYRYFIHNWPKLCFLAMDKQKCIGAIVCKLDLHKKVIRRGYIAMLAVDQEYRRRRIGSHLVLKAIRAMIADDCDEVVLETEITNKGALRLYGKLGFVRDKRLFRYYLNGVDALRLKLWLR